MVLPVIVLIARVEVSDRLAGLDAGVSFTPTEFALITLLVRIAGGVLSWEEILNWVWGYQAFPSTRTVDTHILQLRQKLPGLAIETVRGIGWLEVPARCAVAAVQSGAAERIGAHHRR